MLDMVQKGLLTGLGVAVVTREKIMAVTSSLVRDGKISTEDAEKLAAELFDAGQRHWQEVQEKVVGTVRGGLETMDIGSHKEIRELRERLDNLEQRLMLMEDRLPTVAGEAQGGD
jgi:polyhydroxyalkanoate synthesis regulator phasin